MRLWNKSLIGLLFLLILLAGSSLEAASITTTVCPGVGCVNYNVAGQGSIGIQITGTWVGTITFQSTLDNSTYTSFRVVSAADTASSGVLTSTGNGIWNGTVAGISQIRVVFTAWTSGTAVISVRINNQAVKFNGGGGGSGGLDCSSTSDTQVFFNLMGACGGDNQFEFNPGVAFAVAVGASFGVSPDNVSMQSKASILGQAAISLTSSTFPTPGNVVVRGNTAITGLLTTTSTINGLTINSSNSSTTQVLFNDANTVAGNAGMTYDKTTNQLYLFGNGSTNTSIIAEKTNQDETAQPAIQSYYTSTQPASPGRHGAVESYFTINPTADQVDTEFQYGLYSEIDVTTAFDTYVQVGNSSLIINSTTTGAVNDTSMAYLGSVLLNSSGTISKAVGFEGFIENEGTGTITNAYVFYAYPPVNNGGGTITTAYGMWIANQTLAGGTTDYAIWYDGGGGNCDNGGVYRVNQYGIPAVYNPCFTAYVPDATDFERSIVRWGDTGVFGTDNIGYIGLEKGGSGTLRTLTVLGNIVTFETTPGVKAPVTALSFQPTSAYKSVDGTSGATVTTCTGFKNGLCISGT